MNLKVLKFGGSSLADAEHFRAVADIVKSEPERKYVVASAPGKRNSSDIKVTDMLYECYMHSDYILFYFFFTFIT